MESLLFWAESEWEQNPPYFNDTMISFYVIYFFIYAVTNFPDEKNGLEAWASGISHSIEAASPDPKHSNLHRVCHFNNVVPFVWGSLVVCRLMWESAHFSSYCSDHFGSPFRSVFAVFSSIRLCWARCHLDVCICCNKPGHCACARSVRSPRHTNRSTTIFYLHILLNWKAHTPSSHRNKYERHFSFDARKICNRIA